MSEIRERAIPGVKCGKCLGRIDPIAVEMKQKIHAKLYPGKPCEPPRLCSECWLLVAMSVDDDDIESVARHCGMFGRGCGMRQEGGSCLCTCAKCHRGGKPHEGE